MKRLLVAIVVLYIPVCLSVGLLSAKIFGTFWPGYIFGGMWSRGFQAEIPVWKQRIDDLSGRYSSLSPKEKIELQEDKSILSVAQSQTIEFLEKSYCGHDALWRQRQEEIDLVKRRLAEDQAAFGIGIR